MIEKKNCPVCNNKAYIFVDSYKNRYEKLKKKYLNLLCDSAKDKLKLANITMDEIKRETAFRNLRWFDENIGRCDKCGEPFTTGNTLIGSTVEEETDKFTKVKFPQGVFIKCSKCGQLFHGSVIWKTIDHKKHKEELFPKEKIEHKTIDINLKIVEDKKE